MHGKSGAQRRSGRGQHYAPLMVSAFDSTRVGLMLVDEAGAVLTANLAAARDFGYDVAGLAGTNLGSLVPGLSPDGFGAFLERHRRVGGDELLSVKIDVEASRSDGSTFVAQLGVSQFDHLGRPYYLCSWQDTTAHREYRALNAHLARHDRLTGCLNRFGVEDHLDEITESTPEARLAVVYLEFNRLAGVDQSHSREVELGLLRDAVARLRGVLGERNRLGRVGRNEFVAVVSLDADTSTVSAVAEALAQCFETPLEANAWRLPVRASIGASLYPAHARTPEALIDRAEAAMRRAKRHASPHLQLYTVEGERRDEARYERLERVRLAVDRGELTLHYQPQFELTTLQTTGLEALLRWQHPQEGLVPPAEFLSLLVESGLMPTVSRWVLWEAVAMNARLAAAGVLDVPVAVNVGPAVFEEHDFVAFVRQVVDEHGVAADRLEVEITEATTITAPAQVTANARALRDLGVGVAIDDFGTGFSSLKRLRLANFSKLKIDRTFVSLLPGDARDQTVITGLLDLADGLDMEVVAEGIETAQQLDALRTLGCRQGQGYWYGRPMAEADLRAWMGSRGAVAAAVDAGDR